MKKNNDNSKDSQDYHDAVRSVCHSLNKNIFKIGERSGSYQMKCEHIAMRNEYLRVLIENRNLPPNLGRREVYTDESYVHHHHHRNDMYIL